MSTLNVDALVGVSSANAITVRGEGTATTSLQQGLVKAWFNLNSDDDYRDKFNITDMTDIGTGDHQHNFTNVMSSDDFCTTTGTNGSNSQSGINSYNMYYEPASTSASFVRTKNISSGGTPLDNGYVMGMVAGDLA
jgi:hypothetical protein